MVCRLFQVESFRSGSGAEEGSQDQRASRLDLRELRSHKISFLPVTDRIIPEAESLVASTNTYAADAVHVSTYRDIAERLHLDGFLCDDIHYGRFRRQVPVKTIADIKV